MIHNLMRARDLIAKVDSYRSIDDYTRALQKLADQHGSAALDIRRRAGEEGLSASEAREVQLHNADEASLLAEIVGRTVDYDQVLTGPTRSGDVTWSGDNRHDSRDGTHRAADTHLAHLVRDGLMPAGGAELLTKLMEHGTTGDRSAAQRYVAATSDPAYLRAFTKICLDDKGHLEFDADELRAYRAAREVQREMRDLSEGTPSAGGYIVPSSLSPSVLLSNAGVVSPVRSVARVETLSQGSTWTGITSAGVSSEFKAELAEAAEVNPTFAAPSVDTFLLSTYIEFSYELAADGLEFLQSLQVILTDAASQKLENAYATGTGVGEPLGIIPALVANAGTVAPAVAEVLGKTDVYAVQEALSPRWQPRASWLASLSIINDIAQMSHGTDGGRAFPEVATGGPENSSLLRRPLREWSLLDDSPDAAATAANYVLAYGDWRSAYVCVDRIGGALEINPVVLGSNRRPIGARGAHLWMRHGGGPLISTAAKLLSIPTAA